MSALAHWAADRRRSDNVGVEREYLAIQIGEGPFVHRRFADARQGGDPRSGGLRLGERRSKQVKLCLRGIYESLRLGATRGHVCKSCSSCSIVVAPRVRVSLRSA